MTTESQIKAAMCAAAGGKPRTELHDRGARGAGRLVLIVRWNGEAAAPSAEFYACWYRDGRRLMSKLGSPPRFRLRTRKRFREEFAPTISAGGEPASAAARRRHRNSAGTVAELFGAPTPPALRGPASARLIASITFLIAAAESIGSCRPAAEVTPDDIVPHRSEIHECGSIVQAPTVRAYLSAAFADGMKAEHDYIRQDAGARWGLTSNPIAAIPVADGVSNPRNRFLAPAEVRTLWLWLEGYDVDSGLAAALRLMLATGQRSEEILRITAATYEPSRALLYWERSKNGLPHSIPLPYQAAKIIDGLHANAHGLFFPCSADPARPAPADRLRSVKRFREAQPEIPKFVPRDCRRSFKTLAGDAGVSKELRDRLQNHAKKSDVSTRHYDRYDYCRATLGARRPRRGADRRRRTTSTRPASRPPGTAAALRLSLVPDPKRGRGDAQLETLLDLMAALILIPPASDLPLRNSS
jgi:integrase